MPLTPARLGSDEYKQLYAHLQKHKVYPYRIRFNKAGTALNFATATAAGGYSYFTRKWIPNVGLGIVSFATNMLITPNTVVSRFGIALSYSSVLQQGDGGANSPDADEEATQFYELKTQGGAIDDFQVFYPTDFYVEAGTPIYVHVFADTTILGTANLVVEGHVIFGTMRTELK